MDTIDKVHNTPLGENISNIILLISQKCNLKCTYCFGDNGEYSNCGLMSFEIAKNSIQFLMSRTKSKDLNICFFGGEPLINTNLIKEIITYTKLIENNSDIRFSYSMTTNGTLINDEIEQMIVKYNINTMISIDGDKETQDHNRFYANKKGSYEIVFENTKELRNRNLLSARATLTNYNMNILDIHNHLSDLGFKSVTISPANNLLTSSDYDELIENQANQIKEFETLISSGFFQEARKMNTICKILHKINKSFFRTRSCGAGRTMWAIDIDGNIYPCQRFVNDKRFVIGNVNSKIVDDNFLRITSINYYKKCESCWARNLCVGGCANENSFVNGKVNEPSQNICKYYLAMYEQCIKLYLRLSYTQKEKLGIK